MKVKNLLLLISICLALTQVKPAQAIEPGYNEAMEYFVHRKKYAQNGNSQNWGNKSFNAPVFKSSSSSKSLPKNSSVSSSVNPSIAALIKYSKKQKLFMSLGYELDLMDGSLPFEDVRLFEIGSSYNLNTWVQSNLSLEWRTSPADNQDSLLFMYSLQTSSVLFFLGPELGLGSGRSWLEDSGGGFTSLKLGLNLSNPWSRRFLFSMNLYYRRDQLFNETRYNERLGAVLKIGF